MTTMDWFFAFSSFLLLIVACSGSEQRSSAVLEAIHTVLEMIQRDIKNVNQDIKDIKGKNLKKTDWFKQCRMISDHAHIQSHNHTAMLNGQMKFHG